MYPKLQAFSISIAPFSSRSATDKPFNKTYQHYLLCPCFLYPLSLFVLILFIHYLNQIYSAIYSPDEANA